jgi:hypothetical protein
VGRGLASGVGLEGFPGARFNFYFFFPFFSFSVKSDLSFESALSFRFE